VDGGIAAKMIGSIKGTVTYLTKEYCLLETTGGVGYRVFMPSSQLATLASGSEVKVLTYTVVREDALLLYGFLNRDYYNLFMLLIGVSGVGPKSSLGMLSAIKPEAFYLAVQSRDLKVLTKLPGIGKKTAERMLLELKDKVGSLEGVDTSALDGNGQMPEAETNVAEAIAALTSLGYSNSEILPALQKIPDYAKLPGEEIIRKALKLFATRV
jgi:Holliday junction DNA helicase RuvA